MDLEKLKTLRQNVIEHQRKMLDKADAEKRGLTPEEEKQYEDFEQEYSDLTEEIRKILQQHDGLGQTNRTSMLIQSPGNQTIEIRNEKKLIGVNPSMITENYIYNENGTATRDAYNRYLKYGPNAISPQEFRALQADSDSAGGFLVTPLEVSRDVIAELNNALFIRQLAKKFTVPNAQSLGCPALDDDFGDPTWTSELGTGSEDNDMDFERRDLTPHPAARRLRVSNKLLRASSLNPEAIVRERMIYKMSVVHENAFLNGDGNNKPLGVFVADAQGINTDRDISTGNTNTSVTVDGLKNAVGHMKAQYRQGAVWVMHRDLETRLSKLKTGDGVYLWQASIDGKNPNMLCGFPVYLSEYAPNTFTTGQYVAILANFSFYYIVDALDMQIQRLTELYAETAQTGFIIRTECDAMPVLSSGFVRVQLT